MPHRRALLTVALVTGVAARAFAQDTTVDYLLVQTAKGFAFDPARNTLRLTGISPITLFFSDRPERIAGNMRTTLFPEFWSHGRDSFAKDPPNADVSIIMGIWMRQVVAMLNDPVLEGDTLRYTVRVLRGEMPMQGEAVSVFIDVIGMPRTAVSYAGVDRRTYRRAWY